MQDIIDATGFSQGTIYHYYANIDEILADLNADDIDVLIPEKFLKDGWCRLVDLMEADGYRLIDLHEHFRKKDLTVAYAALGLFHS